MTLVQIFPYRVLYSCLENHQNSQWSACQVFKSLNSELENSMIRKRYTTGNKFQVLFGMVHISEILLL